MSSCVLSHAVSTYVWALHCSQQTKKPGDGLRLSCGLCLLIISCPTSVANRKGECERERDRQTARQREPRELTSYDDPRVCVRANAHTHTHTHTLCIHLTFTRYTAGQPSFRGASAFLNEVDGHHTYRPLWTVGHADRQTFTDRPCPPFEATTRRIKCAR